MDGLYKDIKDALPERLDSCTKVQKVEQSLQTSLCALQDQQSDEKCLLLLKSGIIYLIKVMHLLNRSVPLKIENNILNLILDSLVAASEHGSLSNSFVVSFSTDRCLAVILNDKFPFVSRIEVLNKLNLILESTDAAIKEKQLQTEACRSKLKSLFQLVLHVGDYEFQVCIVEFLFRLLPRKLRQKYSKNFIMDPETLGAFLAVKDSCFEVDCRKFLNQLNSSLAEDRRVYSFPCCKITLGPIELQKPCDKGYNDFWLDLNMGSKRMIIFCENAQLSSSQVSASDDCWDTVSVWHTDVHKIVCQEEQGQLHAEVHIKSTAGCVPRCCEPGSRPVLHIIVDTKYNFEAVLGQVFGQKKVSDVATPIHCYTDNPSQENFAQELDDREEVDEVEEEDESVYPVKELVRAQDPPGSMRTGQGKMFKVSTPASTITVGSVCSTTSSREKNRVASIVHTPQARTTRSKKKVKTPVVTLQEPVTKPTSANTRKTVKPKFVPPPALEMGNEKQAVDCQEEHKESPPSVVIPDSMPFPSQTNAEPPQPPQISNRKTQAKVCDSGISVNEEEKQHQFSTNSESSITKSVKVQRSKSSKRLLRSQEAPAENPSRTLRSSQNKTSQKSSGAEHASLSQKSGRRRTLSKSETMPSQNSVVEKKSCVNKNNIFTEPENSQTVPSSLEKFKAPKSKKALTGATTKTVSSSSSSLKCNASGSQRSRKRLNARGETENSAIEEKLQRPGRGSQKTRQHADNVLQDCTNTLKSSSKQEQPSSGQQLTRPSSQLSCAKSTNHRGGGGRAGHPSDNTEDENVAECRFEVEPVTSPQSSPPGHKPQESTLEESLTDKAGSSCHHSKARESRKDGAAERKTAGDSRMSIDNHPEIGDFSTIEQPKGTSLPTDPEAESDKAPKQKESFEREKCPKAVSGDKQNVTLCKSTEKLKMSAQGKSVGDKTINGKDTHQIHAVTVHLSHTDAQKTNSEQSHDRQREMHMSDKTDTQGDHQQVSKCLNKENIPSVRHGSSPSNKFESHEKHSDVSSDKRHKGQTSSNFESEDDDSINYRFEIETDTQLNAQHCEQECPDGKKVSSIQLDPSNQKQIYDTETCREKTANQSGARRAETSTEYESEDDDATYYRFELDTPRETPLKPSPLASASKEAQRQEQGTHGSKTQNRSKKPTFQFENEDFDDDQLAAQQDPGAEKHQYNTALKTSGKTKHLKYSFQKNRSKPNHEKICSRQDIAMSTDLNAMSATAEQRNEDDNSVPPSRNLRKRQPKSYKESDESLENLEVDDIQKKSQQKQAQSRSILSNKKYLFTKAELSDHQKRFVHKTFTMTISSTREQTHSKRLHTDPYAFEEESTAHRSCKSATTSIKQCHAGQTTSRDQSKMMTPRSGAFSWDDDNDADAEGSQENEMARVNEHSLASWRSSFSPIKFITPDPIFQRSDDSQDQTSPHRLFYSQKKKARPRVSHKPCSGGLPTSSAAADTTKQRWTKKASKTDHVPKNTSRSRKNGTPGAESLCDLSDAEAVVDTKSEVSWIVKHKSHVRSDPTKKKTYKRKPVNPTSPKNSPNQAFSWQKPPERSSELDSVSSSPEQPPVTMTPKHRSKKMYSPLDITVGSTPSMLCGAGDISDNFGRTSSKSKTSLKSALTHRTSLGGSSLCKRSFQSVISCSLASTKSLSATGGAPAPGSQESTSSEITGTRELEQLRIAAESSPSPHVSTSRFAQGKAAPVKLSNKAAKKLHKVNDEEEEEDEEDGEEMRLLKERGLVSGPSSIIRPRESVLKRTFGECSDFASEEEEENSQSAKRLCLQPRELFPGCINSLPDSAGEKSKRKSQPSSKHSPQKPSKKTNSKTTSTALMEVMRAELSEEEVLPLEMPAPSVSTDELLSQPEMELGVEDPVTGVPSLLKGFGFDLQKQMKEREHQVQEMAKGALKLTNKRVNHLWTTDRNKRGQVLNNFRDQINTDLSALEKDVAALNDIEKKAEVAYLQQIKVLHDHREKLLRRVRSVKECHEDFRLETEQVEGQSHESQRCLEAQMKKDLEQLKIKLLLDMQQQQLRRVKESLQKHFI